MELIVKKNERIAAMTRILCSHPNKNYTLNYFSELFHSGKSTICEDMAVIRSTLLEFHLGDVVTTAGAGGGIRFVPMMEKQDISNYIVNLCHELSEPNRILAGGYLYMNDILHDPQQINQIGEILATRFMDTKPDFVFTVETKGTPAALAVAHFLGCPVVVAGRDGQAVAGPLVSINYVTASTRRIQTMSISKRAITEGSRALIIDDFMKGGGTARGMANLLKEFHVDIVGTGFVISTREPVSKLVDEYTSLMVLEGINEGKNQIKISAANWITD